MKIKEEKNPVEKSVKIHFLGEKSSISYILLDIYLFPSKEELPFFKAKRTKGKLKKTKKIVAKIINNSIFY